MRSICVNPVFTNWLSIGKKKSGGKLGVTTRRSSIEPPFEALLCRYEVRQDAQCRCSQNWNTFSVSLSPPQAKAQAACLSSKLYLGKGKGKGKWLGWPDLSLFAEMCYMAVGEEEINGNKLRGLVFSLGSLSSSKRYQITSICYVTPASVWNTTLYNFVCWPKVQYMSASVMQHAGFSDTDFAQQGPLEQRDAEDPQVHFSGKVSSGR